jgi:hypothetical protein
MKVISIWQPWASLIVHNHKFNETRGWAAPKSLIGKTIGIASTKVIRPEQRVAYLDPSFQNAYQRLNYPCLDQLYCGYLLGTALLHSCEVSTPEQEEDMTEQELAFGWYGQGRYIWRLRQPRALVQPIPVRGAQGIWDFDVNGALTENLCYLD